MICAACNAEPSIGKISVPWRNGKRTFPIGTACYRLQRDAMRGTVRIGDFARICTFVPTDAAAELWLRALLDEMRPVVSRQVRWRKCAVCEPSETVN